MMPRVALGRKVKDKVTGFAGIATARTEYMNGCVRVLVEAKCNKDGKSPSEWFDEQRLGESSARAGGPGPTPRITDAPR
jgi:hypothetical protein